MNQAEDAASTTATKGEGVQDLPTVNQESENEEENWQIQWRRNKVMQLLSQGKIQREIARELNVHESTISRDIDHIQQEINEEHKHWVEQVFRENQIALAGLTEVLKDLWHIARDERRELSDRLKAYLAIMECYSNRLKTVYNKRFANSLREQYEQWLKAESEAVGETN